MSSTDPASCHQSIPKKNPNTHKVQIVSSNNLNESVGTTKPSVQINQNDDLSSLTSCIDKLSCDTPNNSNSVKDGNKNTSTKESHALILGDTNYYPHYYPWLLQDHRWYHYHKDFESNSGEIHQSYDLSHHTPYACEDTQMELDLSILGELGSPTPGGETSICPSPRSKKHRPTDALPGNTNGRNVKVMKDDRKQPKPPSKPNYIYDHRLKNPRKYKKKSKAKKKRKNRKKRQRQNKRTKETITIPSATPRNIENGTDSKSLSKPADIQDDKNSVSKQIEQRKGSKHPHKDIKETISIPSVATPPKQDPVQDDKISPFKPGCEERTITKKDKIAADNNNYSRDRLKPSSKSDQIDKDECKFSGQLKGATDIQKTAEEEQACSYNRLRQKISMATSALNVAENRQNSDPLESNHVYDDEDVISKLLRQKPKIKKDTSSNPDQTRDHKQPNYTQDHLNKVHEEPNKKSKRQKEEDERLQRGKLKDAISMKSSPRKFHGNNKYSKSPTKPMYINDHKGGNISKKSVTNSQQKRDTTDGYKQNSQPLSQSNNNLNKKATVSAEPKQSSKVRGKLEQKRSVSFAPEPNIEEYSIIGPKNIRHFSIFDVSRGYISVMKFYSLCRSKVVLGDERFKALRKIFVTMDANHSGRMTRDEATEFNEWMDPEAKPHEIERDVNLLFQLADFDKNGYITEQEWFRGWSAAVTAAGGDFTNLDAFIAMFHSVIASRPSNSVQLET